MTLCPTGCCFSNASLLATPLRHWTRPHPTLIPIQWGWKTLTIGLQHQPCITHVSGNLLNNVIWMSQSKDPETPSSSSFTSHRPPDGPGSSLFHRNPPSSLLSTTVTKRPITGWMALTSPALDPHSSPYHPPNERWEQLPWLVPHPQCSSQLKQQVSTRLVMRLTNKPGHFLACCLQWNLAAWTINTKSPKEATRQFPLWSGFC